MTRSPFIAAVVIPLLAAVLLAIFWRSDNDHLPPEEPSASDLARDTQPEPDPGHSDFESGEANAEIGISAPQVFADSGDLIESERLAEGTDPQSRRVWRALNPLLWWPQSPELTESLMYSALSQHLPDLISVEPIQCEETRCEIFFVQALERPEFLTDPAFITAILDLGVAGTVFSEREGTDGVLRSYLAMYSYSQVPNNPTLDNDALFEAANRTPEGGVLTTPQILGNYQGFDVLLSGACAYDCPSPSGVVVMLNVPPDRSCSEIGGIEQSIPWNTPFGVEAYGACIPSILVDADI